MIKARLAQRGRAAIDFMSSSGPVVAKLYQAVNRDIEKSGIDINELPDDLDERDRVMQETLKSSKAFRVQQLLGDWHGRTHGAVAIEAFEETKDAVLPKLHELDEKPGAAELHLDKDLKLPAWWSDHWIHRTTGGWDGHPYMGFVHGEIVHREMVQRSFPGGIFKQRRMIAETAPKDSYGEILEMGTSSGHFTEALQEIYPDANITGVELSARMLEHAYRIAKDRGYAWKLYQRDATNTGLEANSFDLVTSYILLHEVPVKQIKEMFAEAFRLLRPGGDLLMSDVTRYADQDKLSVWRADLSARFGGEPYWRASASLDLAEVATEAGFVEAKSVSVAPMNYPHYVVATKPE